MNAQIGSTIDFRHAGVQWRGRVFNITQAGLQISVDGYEATFLIPRDYSKAMADFKMKPQIPIDPKDWTVEDWRDLWNGIEEIRHKIAMRHDPTLPPPPTNAHVAEGCEQFDAPDSKESLLIRRWRWGLYDACGEIEKLPPSVQETKCVSMVGALAHEMQQFLIDGGHKLGRDLEAHIRSMEK